MGDLAEMRRAIVKEILDNGDEFEIRRAVEEYVESWSDETVSEWYKDVANG